MVIGGARSARSTVAVLAVGVGAFGLLQSLIVPVLAQVQERFETDQSTVTWVLTAYLLAAAGTVLFVPPSPVTMAGRISITPAVLLSGWLVALLLAISEGNDLGWASGTIVGLFAAAGVLFAGWLLSERRAAVPLIDIQLMRVRGVWTSNAVAFVAGFGTFASLSFLPQLLQTPVESGYGFGDTISQSGWVLFPSSAVAFVMGFIAPRLVRRVSARRVVSAGVAVNALAFGGIALFHDETWQISGWMLLQGLGIGCVVSSLAGVVLSSVPPHQTGVASGMNANIRLIGGAMGSAMMAGILSARTGAGGFPLEVGYRDGFLVLSGLSIVAIAVAMMIPRVPGHLAARQVDVGDEPDVDIARIQI